MPTRIMNARRLKCFTLAVYTASFGYCSNAYGLTDGVNPRKAEAVNSDPVPRTTKTVSDQVQSQIVAAPIGSKPNGPPRGGKSSPLSQEGIPASHEPLPSGNHPDRKDIPATHEK
jgi:hypothetical protein